MTNTTLYYELLDYNFDKGYTPDTGLSFIEKLMLSNNWTKDYTERVIVEYKRFLYLMILFSKAAPSDAIDQVWHQHILYTKEYELFCEKYAGRYLHHTPDRNYGKSQDSYEVVTNNYEAEFDEEPNKIWQLTPIDYVRVDLTHNYLVPIDNAFSALKALFLTIKNKLV